jgi:Tol biopolymer transport system component
VSSRSGEYELWLMGANGSGVVKFSKGGVRELYPSWSPDGKRIAFVSEVLGGAIQWRTLDGKATVGVAGVGGGVLSVTDPAWSPDGQRLAYTQQTATSASIVVRPAFNQPIPTVEYPAPAGKWEFNVAWAR